MTSLADPGKLGEYKPKRIIYAAPELDFLNTNDLQDHCVFDNPIPGYETRRIDFCEVVNFDYSTDWKFSKKETPINGIFCLPEGDGPFPLAVIVHGNSNYKFNSAPGFLYLCDLLAYHGIIAASIDVSFISIRNNITIGQNGKVLGRAITVLEHLKQFRLWNQKDGHPLQNKVDLERCMIVGHSRGGEAVGHASVLNHQQSPIQFYKGKSPLAIDGSNGGLGPYNFGIQAVVALAPTDQSYRFPKLETILSDNYLVIQGSRDQDVKPFEGQLIYDRSHPLGSNDSTPSGIKSLLWIHKANHNYFNSVWEPEPNNIGGIISPDDQRKIAATYISAFAQATLLEKKEYLQLLQNYQYGIINEWLPKEITYVSQYQSHKRLVIQDFEESGIQPTISCSNKGSIIAEKIIVQVQQFLRFTSDKQKDPSYHLYQDTKGIRIDWTEFGGKYVLKFDDYLDAKEYDFLAFRVGQSFESNNTPDQKQDFTLMIHDTTQSISLPVSYLQSIPYPDVFENENNNPVTVLQTVFLPINQLSWQGINISQVTSLEFVFNITSSGTVYIDDIQLTNLV
ncbi:hypothetical protein [Aphanothece sacrum]|uniref:Membrane protein n=1 Tax=Aphanothece sacrum FPU1 TaxID=1920663 RepID=A0A401IBI5_APHSA|nr:hypothetical protein [Aphanothece sacrum]GBF78615.1 membrane protein [Aphanothece sacrum FPU1]GBF84874.1 membrane protein [Aphanothece sacrum FPU3]